MKARIVRGSKQRGFFLLCVILVWAARASADANTAVTPSPSPTLSGCQVCASSGDCSHAYLDAPGQFCGNWLDKANQRQRCCCPRDATCRVSNYECRCSTKTPSSTKSTAAGTATVSTGGWVGVAVGAFLFMACCSSVCWWMQRTFIRNKLRSIINTQRIPPATVVPTVYGQPPCNGAPVAMPVAVGYGAQPVQYPYPGMPSAQIPAQYPQPGMPVQYPYQGMPSVPMQGYSYGNHYPHQHNNNNNGGGFSSALGTVAGLVTGMAVADAILDGGRVIGGLASAAGEFGGDF